MCSRMDDKSSDHFLLKNLDEFIYSFFNILFCMISFFQDNRLWNKHNSETNFTTSVVCSTANSKPHFFHAWIKETGGKLSFGKLKIFESMSTYFFIFMSSRTDVKLNRFVLGMTYVELIRCCPGHAG